MTRPRTAISRVSGVSSPFAIPIAYEGTVYGVLNVYAKRKSALAGQEEEMLAEAVTVNVSSEAARR